MKQARRRCIELTTLDLLALLALPHDVLVAKVAYAVRNSTVDELRLARMLYDDRNEQGRFLLDVQSEADRQNKIHSRRRSLKAGRRVSRSKRDRIQNIASGVFGSPATWVGSLQHLTGEHDPFLIYHWVACYGSTRVTGVGIGRVSARLNLLVYKTTGTVSTRYVVMPVHTSGIQEAFQALGLTRRSQDLAQVVVDWAKKRFIINGRDIIPWRYT